VSDYHSYTRAITVSPPQGWGHQRTSSYRPGFSRYHSWDSSTAFNRSTNSAGSHVSESYPVQLIRYCSWLQSIQLSSTLGTWYSTSPSTLTGGGGVTHSLVRGLSTTGCRSDMGCTQWILIEVGRSQSYAYGDTWPVTANGPSHFQSNFRVDLVVWTCWASNQTWDPLWICGAGIQAPFPPSSCTAQLRLIFTQICPWTGCMVAWTQSASIHRWFCPSVAFFNSVIWRFMPYMAMHGVHFVVSDVPWFTANSAIGSCFMQSGCWWFTEMCRYCSMLAFIHSVWPSVFGWQAVNILQSIPSHWHIWPQSVEANWGPQSEAIFVRSPWRHTTSFCNNSVKPEASIIVWQGPNVASWTAYPLLPILHKITRILVTIPWNPSKCLRMVSAVQAMVKVLWMLNVANSGNVDTCGNFRHINRHPVSSASNNILTHEDRRSLAMPYVLAMLSHDVPVSTVNATLHHVVHTVSPYIMYFLLSP